MEVKVQGIGTHSHLIIIAHEQLAKHIVELYTHRLGICSADHQACTTSSWIGFEIADRDADAISDHSRNDISQSAYTIYVYLVQPVVVDSIRRDIIVIVGIVVLDVSSAVAIYPSYISEILSVSASLNLKSFIVLLRGCSPIYLDISIVDWLGSQVDESDRERLACRG